MKLTRMQLSIIGTQDSNQNCSLYRYEINQTWKRLLLYAIGTKQESEEETRELLRRSTD